MASRTAGPGLVELAMPGRCCWPRLVMPVAHEPVELAGPGHAGGAGLLPMLHQGHIEPVTMLTMPGRGS